MSILALLGVALAVAALRQIRGLQRELGELRQQLARLQAAATLVQLAPTTPAGEAATVDDMIVDAAAVAAPSAAADIDLAGPASTAPDPAPSDESPLADVSVADGLQSATPPGASRPTIAVDWERWIGGRGAAVLGGGALALAGLLLFRYSIEHGLIPPWLRVTLGFLSGTACLAAAEWVLRQRYAITANPVAGGGIVILYASSWAIYALYGLVGPQISFFLMALVTVTCCLLSWRYEALVIAILGLLGGFLAPLLLSTGADRPFGLFGYLLLLDCGLLYLAQRRNWPILALLCLVGTGLYEAGWFLVYLDAPRRWLGLAITGLFAAVFALAGRGLGRAGEASSDRLWLVQGVASVALPFAFVLYFAGRTALSPHLYPIAGLLCLLTVAAIAIARELQQAWIGLAAAGATLAVIALWLVQHPLDPTLAWEVVFVCLLLGAVLQIEFEWIYGAAALHAGPSPVLLILAGLFVQTTVAGLGGSAVGIWPWLVGWSGLAVLLCRHAASSEHHALRLAAGVALGFSVALLPLSQDVGAVAVAYLGSMVLVAIGAQGLAVRQRASAARVAAEAAAACLAITLTTSLAMPLMAGAVSSLLYLFAAGLLGLLASLAAVRLASGKWLLAAIAETALAHLGWTVWAVEARPNELILPFVAQLVAVGVMTALPFYFVAAFRQERAAWVAAALVGPAWFPSLRQLFEAAFGTDFIGVLPLGLAAVSLFAAQQTRRIWPTDPELRQQDITWFLAMAACFVAVAIPLQLQREWITMGWALEGLAVLLLWRRIDNPGLKYLALLLLAGATWRLIPTDVLLSYYARPRFHVINWLLYTYLVPAAALLGSAVLLGRAEVERVRPWERDVYVGQQPVGAIACGLAAVTVVFVWINLCIAEWFSSGSIVQVDFARLPARDLATSIAWAGYALVLLAAGVAFVQRGLRWLSLGLMIATIVKVFWYDLGELQDLYRVASLLGLALSLIVVSLAYQRFVLRDRDSEES